MTEMNYSRLHVYFKGEFRHELEVFLALIKNDPVVLKESTSKNDKAYASAAIRLFIQKYNNANRSKLKNKEESNVTPN